jgi:hypothetical protein
MTVAKTLKYLNKSCSPSIEKSIAGLILSISYLLPCQLIMIWSRYKLRYKISFEFASVFCKAHNSIKS